MIHSESAVEDRLQRLMPGLSLHTEGRHYQNCLEIYNHALNKKPLVCARPRTEEEVSHLGILIDMRDIDSVRVEPDRASARVGGGVIAGHLQETLDSHGLFTPTGQAKSVGYVSWACGGGSLGLGWCWPGGRVVDTNEDPELLWALRGAGAGTCGIVTELRVRVYPVPKLYAGFLAFPLAEAATVMDRIGKLLEDGFPDEFSGDAIAVNPEMAPTPVAEPSTPAAYGLGDSSSGTFFRSRNVDRIHENVDAILARHPLPHPLSAVIFHNNHGKGVRHEVADTVGAAFPNRYQHVILGLHGGTRPGQADEQEVEDAARWVTGLEEALDQNGLSLPGGFPAFWPPDQVDVERFFGKERVSRLRQLKARLDPNDLFHHALPGLSPG
ncbi:hypothetical protein ASPWEDRAFT_55660 [Aspergillus wentii DTO 134E9]|uniref:Berberine/berberine-like domain-containing protein n=1 Tax=Aspergillus wentii DTO 134E9 TaxID=1073089 RepID=A0A1L9RZ23_ASPWE|nr:uncharacterized protein ASPWEDRAFT_55660 [Aspergillus wentii DTO 134E9]OJJ40165.1 hypothetical protein ASPWEDRAFT_55660 [Aspergillus wentii DTO 134E9]